MTTSTQTDRTDLGHPSAVASLETPARDHDGEPRGLQLRNGITVQVRSVHANDRAAVLTFLTDLSAPAQRLRFFTAAADLPTAAAWATGADGRNHLGLVALDHAGRMVGHAACCRVYGHRAEVAVEIADGARHQGLATSLIAELARRAEALGIRAFIAEVLPENHEMLAVFHDGFDATQSVRAGEVDIEFPTSAWRRAAVLPGGLAPSAETVPQILQPPPEIESSVPTIAITPEALPDHLDDLEPSARSPRSGVLRFARMTGSSIAGRDSAFWVTDFLNAAYYRRPAADREVDDLRLAFTILTTYWYRETSGRLSLTDLRAFHAAFGSRRFATDESERGTLNRAQLLDGARQLLGDWFSDAYGDDARRGWGIAFETVEDRAAYDCTRRMKLARLGALTPECAPLEQQTWHTYPPVPMPSVEAVIAALTAPETWPDYASEIGRFTPLRPGGLKGQTFEIEVAAGTGSGRPIFTRGYVTITDLVTPDDPTALAAWFAAMEDGLARYGDHEPRAVPAGGVPVVGFDLTTHQGHFLGNGHNRLLLYTLDGKAWVRAVGTWDPMPWHIQQAYESSGRDAQQEFWGQGNIVARSMLHQLAARISA